MINFYLVVAILFAAAIIGQYSIKKMERDENVDVKSLKLVQLITMLCFFSGGIFCLIQLYRTFVGA